MRISIAGVGRLGGALALALAEKGFEIDHLIVKDPAKAEKIAEICGARVTKINEVESLTSDVLIIATRDGEIAPAAERLAQSLGGKTAVFHTSGVLSSEILKQIGALGCATGSIHPLVSVSDAFLGKKRFENAYFCVEGDARAVEIGKRIVESLGGVCFTLDPECKTLYHASAVTACGHLVALVDAAIEMLAACGLDRREAQSVLLPLIESTVENLKTQTPAEALTGPFARADLDTFERHLEALSGDVPASLRETYLQLGERSTHLAEQQNADREKLEKMRRAILLAKNNLKC